MEPIDASELLERARVVVDAEIEEDVREAGVAAVGLDDEKRGGLLAAAVAAGRLRRVEAVEQALDQRASGSPLERLCERVDRLGRDEDVALRRIAVARAMTGPVVAPVSGEGGAAARSVDDPELALRSVVVGLGQSGDDLLRRDALAEQREPVRPVAGVRVRLRGDRPDARLGPGNDRADGEELRLRGDAPLTCLEVAGADRVRGDDRATRRSSPPDRARGALGPERVHTRPRRA
jgi:hypothetical protein